MLLLQFVSPFHPSLAQETNESPANIPLRFTFPIVQPLYFWFSQALVEFGEEASD